MMACMFDEVLQRSHVARARIEGEGVQRLDGDGIDAFAHMPRIDMHEVAYQQGVIRGLLTQGGTIMENTCSRSYKSVLDGPSVCGSVVPLVQLRARLRPMHQEPARHLRRHGAQRRSLMVIRVD
jgi:hypothetical protein